MGNRRALLGVVLGALLLSGYSPSRFLHAGDPALPRDVVIRGPGRDIPQTVERVLTDSALSTVGTVIFAFEASAFAPPPGRTEFTAFYGYHQDVPAWVEALAAAGKQSSHFSLHAVTSLQPAPIDMRRPAAAAALKEALSYRWAKDAKGQPFRPAATWMAEAVRDARRLTKSERCAVVYVADRVLPERVFEADVDAERERAWRARLAPAGTYFDEEAVGRKLAELKTTLFVVAPEAHFQDFTPWAELPDLPWVARPEIVSWPSFFTASQPHSGSPSTPGGPGGGLGLSDEEIEEILRKLPPDVPEEVRRAMREALKAGLPGVPSPGGPTPPPDAPEPSGPEAPEDDDPPGPTTSPDDVPFPPGLHAPPRMGGKGRFNATTPMWFPRLGKRTAWVNHTPSAFGHWPFARAAALTGGRLLFYPFPAGTWLDVCPTAAPQIADLAPELVKRSEFARVGAGDPAWDALDRAARMVLEETPWEDGWLGDRWASGWGSFTSRRPVVPESRWEARHKPCDDPSGSGQDHESELERFGERLLEKTLPLYARAIRDVDGTLATLRAAQAPKAHPRALADLTLGRFWLAMSRFHLHALGIYAKEIRRFRPEDPKEPVDHYVITYVPTIKLSDVLEAYDGRTLGPEAEAKYERVPLPDVKGQQDNLLAIPIEQPDYRARRDQERVLLHLDERLRDDALDMIVAARAVMERYARTPWGWTTYYSVAFTFVWDPVPPSRGSTGPMGPVGPTPPSEDPDAPVTPGGGGSTGGTPTTPGGR